MTESEMNALRELFADEMGKATAGLESRIGDRLVALENGLRGELGELRVQVGQVLDRLTVVETDISAMRAQLAGLARLDTQRRLESLEARCAALEARVGP